MMLRRRALQQLSLIASCVLAGQPALAQAPSTGRKIAVLLPSASGEYRRATNSIMAGLKAAQSRDGQGYTLDLFAVDERFDSLSNVYNEIAAKGYAFAIGPLTKTSVTQLGELSNLSVPTLALNWPDTDRIAAGNTVFFGLPIESESAYAARAAFAEASTTSAKRPLRASTICNTSPLGRRAAGAFAESWKEQGGVLSDQIETDSRLAGELKSLLGSADSEVYFVATGIETARVIKNNVAKEALLYAPSMLSTGVTPNNVSQSLTRTPELDGYRVTDLPWLIQADNPAVMGYPRQTTLSHQELQRLYGLGIDAFRIAKELLAGNHSFELDGVSGRLKFDRNSDVRIQRTPALAEYRGGVLFSLDKR